ncbi:MAG TPA: TonB-dependent receptor [Caulobacteraceae bacterium]
MNRLLSNTALSTWLIGGLAAVSLAGVAQAQTAAPAADAQPQAMGEIVVTAQKRAERLQDVPQAVQAVTGAKLTSDGVREFADLSKVAPSLVVRPAEQPVNASVSVRGIGTFAFSIGVEPSVAVQVDDVPVAFQARAFADLSDIQRIEVLRGPQSTLYGKSASAGLINIVTPGPTKTLTGRVNVLATGDGEYNVGGVASGPITDDLGFRLSANYDDFGGNVKNLFNGDTTNGHQQGSLYGKLTWSPTNRFKATLGLNYINGDTTIGRPFVVVSPTANLRGNSAQPQSVWAPGVLVGPDNIDIDNNYASGTDYHGFGQSLKMTEDLGGATLMSITSHDDYALHDRLDQDESALASPDNRQIGTFRATQWTQEVRLVSSANQPLRYTLGAFYAGVHETRDFTRGPFYSLANWNASSNSDQEAVFGQFDWEFLPKTTATAGVRYQHEAIDYTFLDVLNGGAFFHGGATDDAVTYRLALNHKITDDLMVYASYATGHKGPTYDLSTGFNNNRALGGPVRPEESGSWELGARTQFFERRLTLNLTAFDALYRDFQAQGIETLADGTVNYRLANVGRIHTRGIELESSGRIGDLQLGASAAYLDAEISSFPLAQCYPLQTAAEGCTGSPTRQNLAGATPPQAPKWKLTADFNYEHPLGFLPVNGVVQGVYSYQSTINFSLSQDPQTIQKSYGIFNLSAGVRDPVRHYEIMAFVNNLFDQHYYVDMFNSSGSYANQIATQALLPRDFSRYAGVRASYSF